MDPPSGAAPWCDVSTTSVRANLLRLPSMKTDPESAGLDATQLERITEHLQTRYIDQGKIAGCQVAVARHGAVAYHRSFGSMDLERDKPMADDTIFRIYSMTKPIAGVALMKLYERGDFQLSDPVTRWIPEWKAHAPRSPW